MNYKTFKKTLMPDLDEGMAEIGFVREKTSMPIYWRLPHEDRRLAWVVCLDFSVRGNPLFQVPVTPYWIPCQHDDEPFPRCVGYKGYLCPDGFGHASHTWWTESREQAEEAIQEVLDALSGPGLEWFEQFSTPQLLFEKSPSAKLASDLGYFDEAKDLYREELKSSFGHLLVEKKTTHATPQESVRKWEIERHERVVKEYRDVFQSLSLSMEMYERELSLVELEALQSEQEHYSNELSADPRSRWLKSQLKYCESRIDDLSKKLDASAS